MTGKKLPKEFSKLSKYSCSWIYSTEVERNKFRVNCTLVELQDFYDAMMPRMEEIADFLNNYSLTELPRECSNLMELALMAMEVAPAVEYYNNPDVPDAVDHEKFIIYPLPNKYSTKEECSDKSRSFQEMSYHEL